MKTKIKTAAMTCLLMLVLTVKLPAQTNQTPQDSRSTIRGSVESTEVRLGRLLKSLEDNPAESSRDRLKVLEQIRKLNAVLANRQQKALASQSQPSLTAEKIVSSAEPIDRKTVPVGVKRDHVDRSVAVTKTRVGKTVEPEAEHSKGSLSLNESPSTQQPSHVSDTEDQSLADVVLQLKVQLTEIKQRLASAERKIRKLELQPKAVNESSGQ